MAANSGTAPKKEAAAIAAESAAQTTRSAEKALRWPDTSAAPAWRATTAPPPAVRPTTIELMTKATDEALLTETSAVSPRTWPTMAMSANW